MAIQWKKTDSLEFYKGGCFGHRGFHPLRTLCRNTIKIFWLYTGNHMYICFVGLYKYTAEETSVESFGDMLMRKMTPCMKPEGVIPMNFCRLVG
jgi:hypothetical protein